MKLLKFKAALLVSCFLIDCIAFAQAPAKFKEEASIKEIKCVDDAGWNDPASPRKIFGNVWYVGTCGISSILITSDKGHILIDGATEQGAALIENNIRALGFRIQDVHYILSTHEHSDHAGGIARLQHDTDAIVMASPAAANTLELGSSGPNDPQFKKLKSFPPISSVRHIKDGETLTLGSIKIKAHATPGHTPGSTSWTWLTCEAKDCKKLAYVDSLTAVSDDDYRYSDDVKNSGVLTAFRKTIETVAKLPCDILLTPHPGASDLWSRLGKNPDSPLEDEKACQRYSENAARNLNKRIEEEKGRKS